MDIGQIVGQLKIIMPAVGLVALLGAEASPDALSEPVSHPLNVSPNRETYKSATFLDDFEFIPGSALLVEGNYVLALLSKFPALGSCTVYDRSRPGVLQADGSGYVFAGGFSR